MIALLLKKEQDARSLPDEQKQMFVDCFQPFGMLPTEFLQMMELAKRREYKKGESLAKQGKTRSTLILLKQGGAVVKRDGIVVGKVRPNSFIGEMVKRFTYIDWRWIYFR